jgi:putative oxidoreductase
MAAPAKIEALLHGALRGVLAAILAYAGVAKVLDPARFVADLDNYRLVPAIVAYGAGLLVPWVEIASAAALLIRPLRLGGWLLAFLLGAGFAVFVGSAWLRGLDISCGCFGGAAPMPVTGWAALRTALYPLLAAAGFWYEARREAVAGPAGCRP